MSIFIDKMLSSIRQQKQGQLPLTNAIVVLYDTLIYVWKNDEQEEDLLYVLPPMKGCRTYDIYPDYS